MEMLSFIGLAPKYDGICNLATLVIISMYLNRPVADTRKHIASRVPQRTIGVIVGE